MDAKRLLSRVAKLIDRMSDQLEGEKTFPEKGKLTELTGLVTSYTALLETIGTKQDQGRAGQSLEDVLTNGQKGAYEDLLHD